MKNLYLFIVAVLFSLPSHAQISTSWPDSTARWVNTFYRWNGGPVAQLTAVDNYELSLLDTLINGTSYRKLDHLSNGYKGAMRSDSGRVFYVPKDSASEFLLYDFTARAGDTLRDVYMEYGWGVIGLDSLIVTSTDTLMIANTAFRRINFANVSGYWVEGIGNSQGLLRDPFANISGFSIKLECMSRGDTAMYPQYAEKPCNLPSIGQITDTFDVFARVLDSSGNALSNYLVYVGPGNDARLKPILQMPTDQRGLAQGKVVPGPYSNLHAYVFNCDGDTVMDHEVARAYSLTDSTLFDFVLDCPADSCEVILKHKLEDADSNKYSFDFAPVGVSPMIISPRWTFSDGSVSMNLNIQKKLGAGWFHYCIDLGCLPNATTCDSLYVSPDCNAFFQFDTAFDGSSMGKTIFSHTPKKGSDYRYHWDFGDGTTSDSIFPRHRYQQAGGYQICLTISYDDGTTSCSDSYCMSHSIKPGQLDLEVQDARYMSVDDLELLKAELYPNPASQDLYIRWAVQPPVRLKLYDVAGACIRTWDLTAEEKTSHLDVSAIPAGTYLLKVEDARYPMATPLIIE